MCGRMIQMTPLEVLRQIFGFTGAPNLRPRYNLAPTQDAAVIRDAGRGREIALLRWGLVPSWAKDASGAAKLINARSETAADKPSFRSAFAQRRCLVPVDGFYEWQAAGEGRRKQPFVIRRPDHAPFALAGLWERWQGPEGVLETFTVLTTAANRTLSALHERMPVVLAPGDWSLWLDPAAPPPVVTDLLRPAPDDALAMSPVSQRVGVVANDDPALLEPAAPVPPPAPRQTSLF